MTPHKPLIAQYLQRCDEGSATRLCSRCIVLGFDGASNKPRAGKPFADGNTDGSYERNP